MIQFDRLYPQKKPISAISLLYESIVMLIIKYLIRCSLVECKIYYFDKTYAAKNPNTIYIGDQAGIWGIRISSV